MKETKAPRINMNSFYKAHKVYGMSKNYHIDRAQGPEPHTGTTHTFVTFSAHQDRIHYPLGDVPNKFLSTKDGYFETVAHYTVPSGIGSETVVYNVYKVEYYRYGKLKNGYLVHIFGLPIVYVNDLDEALDILATRHIAPKMTLPKVTIWGISEDAWTFDYTGRYLYEGFLNGVSQGEKSLLEWQQYLFINYNPYGSLTPL